MNVTETTQLCKLVRALCPAQRWEDETPVIWAGVLREIRLEDATEAVRKLGATERFIAPSDIAAEVKAIRNARLAKDLPAPNVDPDDVASWTRELAAIRSAQADGTLDHDAYTSAGLTLSGVPAIGPDRMIEAPLPDWKFPAAPKPTADDYQPPKAQPKPTVSEVDAARAEEQRARQLAALQAMTEEAS